MHTIVRLKNLELNVRDHQGLSAIEKYLQNFNLSYGSNCREKQQGGFLSEIMRARSGRSKISLLLCIKMNSRCIQEVEEWSKKQSKVQ